MIFELRTAKDAAGERLDVWLERHLDDCTRSQISRLIKGGHCVVEPGQAKPGYMLRGGEAITLEVPQVEPMDAIAEDIPLDVLYEDDAVIAINKPPGMVVHPAIGHLRGTLVNAVLGRYKETISSADEAWRPGVVHRLDQDTSGVILIARTVQALSFFQDAFRERRVTKRYLALVAGRPRADFLEHAGALGRHPKDFRKRCVVPTTASDAKEAYTSVVVLHRCDGYSVVEARPKTGRTHQIRVHLAALGHPVLADATYGRSRTWPLQPSVGQPVLTRQALHAWALVCPHPNGGSFQIEAPIPDDIKSWVPAQLRPSLLT